MTCLTIVSGGQTGVDRGALDAALAAGISCGGWCPAGRRAEDGPLPARYPLQELNGGYAARTRRNVVDSDGTLILHYGELTGGTALTAGACRRHRRPCRLIDAMSTSVQAAARDARLFVIEERISRLNVAGPRESNAPGAHVYARRVIALLLEQIDTHA